jgi:hypothetical protein
MAANGEPLKYGITADYYSKYIWRGQNLNDESVLQPSIYLSKYGFTANIWASQDLTNELDNGGNITEIDYSLDYTAAIPGISGVNWSAGVVHYTFPHTVFESTTEVYAGASLSCTEKEADKGHCLACLLTPSFKMYRDVDEIKGTYYQLGIGHIFEKIATFSENCYSHFFLGASIGYGNSAYNKGYALAQDGKFNDLTLTAGIPLCFGNWTVKPSINYSMMLSDEVRENTVSSDNLWGGVSISCNF